MSERRYSEEEVAEIFERAAEAQQAGSLLPHAVRDGLTLDALQEIGREVGLPPELIARAAKSLDSGGRPATRRFAGLPIAVSRSVELERQLTDTEWEQLVVDLRDTFDARGVVRQDGALRQWSNGNLHVLLEPSGTAARLRMRTMNGTARFWMTGGLALLGVAAVSLVALSGSAPAAEALSKAASIALLGVGSFSVGAFRLPGWARLRQRQMKELGERVSATAAVPRIGER